MPFFLGMALVIAPLQTIQIQMEKICFDWEIPVLNISNIQNPDDIPEKLEELNPKVILASIEDLDREEVQAKLQLVNISYVAIDECQVGFLLDKHPQSCVKWEQAHYTFFFYKNMTYKHEAQNVKNKNIFKNIDQAENLGKVRNK